MDTAFHLILLLSSHPHVHKHDMKTWRKSSDHY